MGRREEGGSAASVFQVIMIPVIETPNCTFKLLESKKYHFVMLVLIM